MIPSRLQIAQAPRSAPSARLQQLTRVLAALRATAPPPRLTDEISAIRTAHA